MLNTLYEQISKACCYITVFLDEELISEGTGFVFSSNGLVFTAAHVITGRLPIRESDYTDPSLKIYAKFANMPVLEYGVGICCIHIQVNGFRNDIQLDQALLLPKQPVHFPFGVFQLAAPPRLGEEVYFAGFSDELELPFNIERVIKPDFPGASEFLDAMKFGYMADMTGPLIKRGVVGNARRVFASEFSSQTKIECEVFYIDNGIHSGASGGPIVNRSGQAVGVIVQRATTSASQSADTKLLVPSGATVGLGLQTIPAMLELLQITQK